MTTPTSSPTARWLGALAVLGALLPAVASAQDASVALVHRLLLDQRMVVTRETQNQPATLGQRLASGDLVVTSSNTRAAIRFTDDGSLVRLNPNSRLHVRTTGNEGEVTKTLELEFGELWARVTRQQQERGFQVQTPSGVAAVKGTEFVVRVDANGVTTVLTLEGAMDFFNGAGTVSVEAGRQATAANTNALATVTEISAEEKAALGALVADDADDDVMRIEIPVQNAEGIVHTVIMEVPRAQAEKILHPGGDQ